MNRRSGLWAVPLMLSLAGPALGQVELKKFQRQLEQIQRDTKMSVSSEVPPGQRALIDYGGFYTFNFLAIDDIGQETHILRQSNLTRYARVNIDGVHEFFLRVRTTYRDFNTGDAFDGHGDDWVESTLDRGHYRFNLGRAVEAYEGRKIDGNLTIQVGRQLVHWANGLTLIQEIDGGQVTVKRGRFTLATVAGRSRTSVTDIDSSRPGFSSDTNRGFYGGMLAYEVTPRHKPYVYGLVQVDDNDSDVLLFDTSGTPGDTSDDVVTRFDYDSYYIGVGSNGSIGDQMLYGVELVYEGGEGLSNSFDPDTVEQVSQTHEDIQAFAADVRVDYLLTDPNRTRLSGEIIIATGDTDRLTTSNTFGGNQPGTHDHAFNGFGLINTGLAFSPEVSNLLLFRLGASTFPLPNHPSFKRLQVGANLFIINKLNRSAPIDEATNGKTYLGIEPDVYANWQVKSDVSLTVRYGVFFPGDAIATDHDTRHFFFTGVTVAF